jgi:hypothetical protein
VVLATIFHQPKPIIRDVGSPVRFWREADLALSIGLNPEFNAIKGRHFERLG